MCSEIAILMVTIPAFEAECEIVTKRFRNLGFTEVFDCYIGTSGAWKSEGWETVRLVNEKHTWGADMQEILKVITAEYVLVCFDDFYPTKSSDPRDIKHAFDKAIESGCSIARIENNFNRRYRLEHTDKQGLYRSSYINKQDSSLVFTLIKKRLLWEMLSEEDSPWLFEKQALMRTNIQPGEIMQSLNESIEFANLVVKGRLLRSSLKRLKKSEYEYLSRRSRHRRFSLFEEAIYHLKLGFHRIALRWLPYKIS